MLKEHAINAAITTKKDVLEKHAFTRKAQKKQLSLVVSKHTEKKQDRINDQVCFGRDIFYY